MLYIEKIRNNHPPGDDEYPFSIPALRNLKELVFRKDVTFITGENGTGKSTLIEALAINAGFNPEGGGRNFNFHTQQTHSELYKDLRLVRSYNRNKDGYFLRAESLYNVATEIDNLAKEDLRIYASYGNKSLHENSHGESFLTVLTNRLFGNGLYIFDEPEAGLSVKSLFALLVKMRELVEKDSQFIIATHSPILLAYPNADIYVINEDKFELTTYEETSQYQLTKYFIGNYESMISELLRD